MLSLNLLPLLSAIPMLQYVGARHSPAPPGLVFCHSFPKQELMLLFPAAGTICRPCTGGKMKNTVTFLTFQFKSHCWSEWGRGCGEVRFAKAHGLHIDTLTQSVEAAHWHTAAQIECCTSSTSSVRNPNLLHTSVHVIFSA